MHEIVSIEKDYHSSAMASRYVACSGSWVIRCSVTSQVLNSYNQPCFSKEGSKKAL